MTAISLLEHPRHTDHLRLRDGTTLTVRFVGPDEGEVLQRYFRNLSVSSRHSRFLGAMSELPATNSIISFMSARTTASVSSRP